MDDTVHIRSRGVLPHWEQDGAVSFITFRLEDSIPKSVRDRLMELKHSPPAPKFDDPRPDDLEQFLSNPALVCLDRGEGACHLRDPRIAGLVRDSLHFFDGKRYRLHAWCIMPNHVHVLLHLRNGERLERVMHSIKSYTANNANELLGRAGPFWQREYYDRIVRDAREYGRVVEYIVQNPAKPLLVDWPWVGYCDDPYGSDSDSRRLEGGATSAAGE